MLSFIIFSISIVEKSFSYTNVVTWQPEYSHPSHHWVNNHLNFLSYHNELCTKHDILFPFFINRQQN